jgi:diguanylate cyclase (GGDEF)-like protein/PAS domain S-box-containing protein
MAACAFCGIDQNPSVPPRAHERFYRRLLDNLTEGVYFVDRTRTITYWNRGAEAITGYSADDVIGRRCQDNLLVHTDSSGRQLCLTGCPIADVIECGGFREAEVFLKHKEGHRVPVHVGVSAIHDDHGLIVGSVEVFRDNSSKLAALEKVVELRQLSLIDPLTLVGNRRYAEAVLQQRWDLFQRTGEAFAMLFIDLDHFKAVNDTYGHCAGDSVLEAVALTLRNNLRSYDFLGRWGGDEFIALLAKADFDSAFAVAERCCGLVRSSLVDYHGQSIRPVVSIGVAVTRPGESVSDLLSRADALLYAAKKMGRNRAYG